MRGPGDKWYKCVPALAAYVADLPEQRLLSAVKGGATLYGCPRCWIPTKKFHLPVTEDTKLRKPRTMQGIVKTGQEIVQKGKKKDANEFSKNYSLHIVKNAFWTVPHFDTYSALLVDELHQLGGAYVYLVECIENTLTPRDIKEINERAKPIPYYHNQHRFSNGFILSSITNPTYDELKDHMAPGDRIAFKVSLRELQNEDTAYGLLTRLIRIYLHTEVEGHPERCALALMPKLSSNLVLAYSRLDIHEKSDDDGESYNEILRANKNFRDADRRDYVELKGGYYGCLLLFLNGIYLSQIKVIVQEWKFLKYGRAIQLKRRKWCHVWCLEMDGKWMGTKPEIRNSWSENKGRLSKFAGKLTTWDDVQM
ncbi:hypothetical protein BJV82DRAFT_582649 [Fennellomyces sp. T-0311]|nr:hypothetical protein BJV82DRAFT_582649 [Fennellomyces sp. T-0311]